MDLMRRLWYVWSWRLRYWWLDTGAGKQARIIIWSLATLGTVLHLVRLVVIGILHPMPPDQPAKAAFWWVAALVIGIAMAAVAFFMRPKIEAPKPMQSTAPNTEDGLAVRDVFGTVWIDDQFVLAWKSMGTQKIKKKGGKK